MADTNPQLLSSILDVLQNIHQDFKEHSARLTAVEGRFHEHPEIAPRYEGEPRDHHDDDCEVHTEGDSSIPSTELAGTLSLGSSPRIGELSDSFPYYSTKFNESLPSYIPQNTLEKYLGDHMWSLPEDGRVQLGFTKSYLEGLRNKSPNRLEPHLKKLQEFDNLLKNLGDSHKNGDFSGDFCVIDVAPSDSVPNIAQYRFGKKGSTSNDVNRAAYLESFISPNPFQTPLDTNGRSPGGRWRRYIYSQGIPSLTQGFAPNNDNMGGLGCGRREEQNGFPNPYSPYFVEDSKNDRLSRNIRDHVFSSRRDRLGQKHSKTQGNVYFHAVFYEIIDDTMESKIGLKKNGPMSDRLGWLFEDPKERMLRRSAVTISAKFHPSHPTDTSDPSWWTLFMMMPSGFLHKKNYLKEEPKEEAGRPKGKRCCGGFELGQMQYFQVAMLEHIVKALQKINMRSRQLSEYMEKLVFEGTTFLNTEGYFNLLFDDDTFSRTKRLFWAAASLDEFEKSLASTLEQWRKYKKVHITSIPEKERSKGFELVKELEEKIDEVIQSLETTRKGFEKQRVHVLALRDGVYNAVAVMESRASTRLGQNVKLLTYISIFYLPLGYCAALWAIPNITQHATQTPFVVTTILVGCFTYILVFNLNILIHLGGKIYKPVRSKFVGRMEKEQATSKWKRRGEQLDQRLKNGGYTTPSEWWLLLYIMSKFSIRTKWFRGGRDDSKVGKDNNAEKGLEINEESASI